MLPGVKRALIVYNPASGAAGDTYSWLGTLVNRLCRQLSCAVTVVPTTEDFLSTHLVPFFNESPDLIVTAGGDGTVRLVLAAVAQAKCQIPVAIIPMGTANVLARNLGIYHDNILVDPFEEAMETIFNGEICRIDMGLMNDNYFSVAAGVGPLSDATITPDRTYKATWKMLAYAVSMIQTFAVPPVVFQIKADHDEFQISASGIFVTNVADMGTGLLSETAKLDDGLLDMCILNPRDFNDYLRLGFHFAGGFFGGQTPYYIRKVKEVTINVLPVRSPMSTLQKMGHRIRSHWEGKQTALPPRYQSATAMIDGDSCGTTPMMVKVVPEAASVLVPKRMPG